MAVLPPVLAATPGIRLRPEVVVYLLVLGLLAFFILSPVVLLLVNSFQIAQPGQPPAYSLEAWRRALTAPGIQQSMVNTAMVVVVTQGISFPIAILVAWLLARTDLPGRHWLEFGFWIPFFLPTLGVTLGWILVLHPSYGLLNTWLAKLPFIEKGPFNIFSFWGIVFVHLATLAISVKVMLLTPIFRNMDSTLEEASTVARASTFETVRHILLPLMTPSLLVILLLGTVAYMNSFEIEQILGFPRKFFVYSTMMYGLVKTSPGEFNQATVLGVMIMVVMLPLIGLQQWITRRRYTTVTGAMKTHPRLLRRWRWPAFALVCALLATVTVIPIVFMFLGSFMSLFGFFDLPQVWSLRHWRDVFQDSSMLRGLWNTIVVSTGTALGSVALYSLVAYVTVRTQFFARRAFGVLTWVPFLVPGVILSLGFLWFVFSTRLLTPLYGTVWLLILANMLTTMTLAVQIFQGTMSNLGFDLEEASRLSGASWWYTFRRVVLPLVMPTVVVVGIITFVSAARQVATVVMLVVGNNHVLSTLQFSFMAASQYEEASVVGSIIVLLCLAVALLTRLLTRRVGLAQP